MKYARLGLPVVAVALVVIVFASRPASGQVQAQTANPAPSGPEYYPAGVPAVTYYAPVTASTPWGGQRGQDPELDKLLAEEGRLDRDAANLIGEYAREQRIQYPPTSEEVISPPPLTAWRFSYANAKPQAAANLPKSHASPATTATLARSSLRTGESRAATPIHPAGRSDGGGRL